MATMQIKSMWFLLLTLLTSQLANAIPKRDVENICRETTDFGFCMQRIDADPRIEATRDLGDVLTLALSVSKIVVDDASIHLGTVSGKYTGPNGRRRVAACKRNYGIASDRLQTAWERCLNKSFREANDLARAATNVVRDCENGWKRGGPPQNSPLTSQNADVSKMHGIVQVLVRKLAP